MNLSVLVCIWFRNANSELTQWDDGRKKMKNLSLCFKQTLKKYRSTAMLSETKHNSGQMRQENPLPTLHEIIRLRSI